jgi:type II secretory pathway pseudopilin PulG
MKQSTKSGFSLLELLVAACAGTLIIIALALALEVLWVHVKQIQQYTRVDTILSVAERHVAMRIANSTGGYFWAPTGAENKVYFFSHAGVSSIIAEGKHISGDSTWVKVEDAFQFGYALLEGNSMVTITSVQGNAYTEIRGVNTDAGTIQLASQEHGDLWVNRGDTVEIMRSHCMLEIRNEQLWIAEQGSVADGVYALDIMYAGGGRNGYGIVDATDPDDGIIACNYDTNHDGQLTVADDADGDGRLDCTAFEPLEASKLDRIEYWILAVLPGSETRDRDAPAETFVAGRNIITIPRNRYPRIAHGIIKINNPEL